MPTTPMPTMTPMRLHSRRSPPPQGEFGTIHLGEWRKTVVCVKVRAAVCWVEARPFAVAPARPRTNTLPPRSLPPDWPHTGSQAFQTWAEQKGRQAARWLGGYAKRDMVRGSGGLGLCGGGAVHAVAFVVLVVLVVKGFGGDSHSFHTLLASHLTRPMVAVTRPMVAVTRPARLACLTPSRPAPPFC